MVFNYHRELEGKHALLGASKYQWLGDSEDEVIERLSKSYLAELGTQLHDVARKRIKFQAKLKKSDRDSVIVDILDSGIPRFVIDAVNFNYIYDNLMNYVNDCVGFRMTPEVVLVYSSICFGTADAVSFDEKQSQLRIYDLKTGLLPAHMEQLLIYAALFCLEYGKKPSAINTELRIYQSNDIISSVPDSSDIAQVMNKIKSFDKLIRKSM